MVLHHELHHIRRHDNLIILLQRVLECVLFFHPCLWLFSRLADRDREHACDDATLKSSTVGERDYAALSLRLSDATSPGALVGGAALVAEDFQAIINAAA